MGADIGKKTLEDVHVAGHIVLVRADLNVPIEDGGVGDDTRIRESLPTMRYLIDRKCRVVVCSHLGRPKGVEPALSLAPVAGRMANLLDREVFFAEDCIGDVARAAVDALSPGGVVLLENLRFHPEEEKNDPAFARELASLAEVFVNDAFGAAHRAHASTEGVTNYLPAVAGFLMAREVRYLSALVAAPPKPFAAIVGGAKVSTKIAAIEHLLPKLDMLLLGGGMANTFLKAQGLDVGASLVEDEQVEIARSIMARAASENVAVHLPVDAVCADRFAADTNATTVPVSQVPPGNMILDIGPQTVARYGDALSAAKGVVWNGPMGVFEMPAFAKGSFAIAKILAELDAVTVVGGGETAAVVAESGLADRFTHVSTGGGASLEMLEGRVLPGVAALQDA